MENTAKPALKVIMVILIRLVFPALVQRQIKTSLAVVTSRVKMSLATAKKATPEIFVIVVQKDSLDILNMLMDFVKVAIAIRRESFLMNAMSSWDSVIASQV